MRFVFLYLVIASSILWGAFYPNLLRLPAYQWLALFFVLTSFSLSANKVFFIVALFILTYTALIAQYLSSFLYCLVIIFFLYFFSSSSKSILRIWQPGNELKYYICWTISLNSVVLLCQYAFLDYQFISGLFPEPSHLGYTIGPLLALIMVNKSTQMFGFVNFFIYFLLSPSLTLVISFFATYIFWLIRATNKFILFLVAILMILLPSILLYLFVVFESSFLLIKFESSQIWFLGYVKAFNFLENVSFFGVGPFGWIPENGEINASSFELELMNQRDLASMIPFGIASFGPLFVIMIFYLLYLVSKFDSADYWDTFFSLFILGYVVTACFRWSGVTLSPLLVFASVLIAVRTRVKPI